MGNKYCKKEANTSTNRINVTKKVDYKFKEWYDKQMGRSEGWKKYARNKKEDGSH